MLPTNIVRGKFDVEDKGLLVGIDLADHLGLQVGDRLALLSGRSLKNVVIAARHTNEDGVLCRRNSRCGAFSTSAFPPTTGPILVVRWRTRRGSWTCRRTA